MNLYQGLPGCSLAGSDKFMTIYVLRVKRYDSVALNVDRNDGD